MKFAETMKRADDHPNAFKLARRIAESWSEDASWSRVKPEKIGHYLRYTVEHDGSPHMRLAVALLEAAMNKVSGNDPYDHYYMSYHTQTKDTLELRKPFPAKEVIRQLDVLQNQLSSNWVKDDQGNYRHVKLFEHIGRAGTDVDLNHYDRLRLTPSRFAYYLQLVTHCSDDEKSKMELLCGFDGDVKKPIKALPVMIQSLSCRALPWACA